MVFLRISSKALKYAFTSVTLALTLNISLVNSSLSWAYLSKIWLISLFKRITCVLFSSIVSVKLIIYLTDPKVAASTDTTIGTITNEEGRFYLESDENWETLIVSFLGFEMQEYPLTKRVNYDLKFTLKEEASSLNEVVIVTGKQSKKASENPAIRILKKIWERKRQNGLSQFKQYQYDQYEKVEFDLNTIDSALIKSKLFLRYTSIGLM